MLEINGEQVEDAPKGNILPTISVGWDNQSHSAMVRYDQKDFRTVEFAIAVLEMAKGQLEYIKRTLQVQAMQQGAIEARQAQARAMQEAQAIKSNLRLG